MLMYDRLQSVLYMRRLGSGGMGEVYLAEDARINQQVAMKVISSDQIAVVAESENSPTEVVFRNAKVCSFERTTLFLIDLLLTTLAIACTTQALLLGTTVMAIVGAA